MKSGFGYVPEEDLLDLEAALAGSPSSALSPSVHELEREHHLNILERPDPRASSPVIEPFKAQAKISALSEVNRLIRKSNALLGPTPTKKVLGLADNEVFLDHRGNNDHAPAIKTKLFDEFWQGRMNSGIMTGGAYRDASKAGARWLKRARGARSRSGSRHSTHSHASSQHSRLSSEYSDRQYQVLVNTPSATTQTLQLFHSSRGTIQ